MDIIWDLCPELSIAPDVDTKRTNYTRLEQLSLVSRGAESVLRQDRYCSVNLANVIAVG